MIHRDAFGHVTHARGHRHAGGIFAAIAPVAAIGA
jgi:hypothetical protein